MRLTDIQIKQIKPETKPYKASDGGGLFALQWKKVGGFRPGVGSEIRDSIATRQLPEARVAGETGGNWPKPNIDVGSRKVEGNTPLAKPLDTKRSPQPGDESEQNQQICAAFHHSGTLA